ncbi:MAG TPA: sigma-54 dependent transcriptional regulator [Candidatus Krumholzibacteria bacterium]|nr:sigma-54 dependent transcriptional regulator [Candidatus Krumholzibacteria bacterium]
MTGKWRILVVDDEPVQRESLAVWLEQDGHRVETASSGEEAVEMVERTAYALYFVDLKMPGMDGIETMAEIHARQPEAAVVVITAYATVDTAISAMKEGAIEYVVKPCNPREISMLVDRVLHLKSLERENLALREKLGERYRFHGIISKNPKVLNICDLVRDVADLPSTVLIRGESGTGKEVVARAIHRAGVRAERPFVAVSCAALAESLLESELFGHEKGAFTGASARREGKLEAAGEGTLFLDEIGDVPPKTQVDLLRVLQEREFSRVGGNDPIPLKARVIAATNRDLEAEVAAGRFREDLYYRLNVIGIRVPPLRERKEDVPLLTHHFVESIALELGREVPAVSEDAMDLLLDHDWPGNVRELENALERALVTAREGVLTAEHFSFLEGVRDLTSPWRFPPDVTLREAEQKLIEETLERHHGNVKHTAEVLGIDRSTLYDKMGRYGIERSRASHHATP